MPKPLLWHLVRAHVYLYIDVHSLLLCSCIVLYLCVNICKKTYFACNCMAFFGQDKGFDADCFIVLVCMAVWVSECPCASMLCTMFVLFVFIRMDPLEIKIGPFKGLHANKVIIKWWNMWIKEKKMTSTFYVKDAVPQCASDGGERCLLRHVEEILLSGRTGDGLDLLDQVICVDVVPVVITQHL